MIPIRILNDFRDYIGVLKPARQLPPVLLHPTIVSNMSG